MLTTILISTLFINPANERVELLKSFEGFRSGYYSDNGQYSIGYGCELNYTRKVLNKNVSAISNTQAEIVLKQRLQDETKKLVGLIPTFNTLPESVKTLLISVHFNSPNLIGPNVKHYIAQKNWKKLQLEIAYGHNPNNTYGLVVRRFNECNIISKLTGVTFKIPKTLAQFNTQKTKIYN